MRSSLACRGLSALGNQWQILTSAAQDLVPVSILSSPALKFGACAVSAANSSHGPFLSRQQSNAAAGTSYNWEQLKRDGVNVNPCHSPHHPAAVEGVAAPAGEEKCVQVAYNPESKCFGCGQANPDGLRIQSRRMPEAGLGRLEARLNFPTRFCAFPGIVNGGVLTTAMDCHGNWAAAIALMDKGCLPRPPLTMTASMTVVFREPTPPNTTLVMRSRVLGVKESASGGPLKATVDVEVVVALPETSPTGEAVEKVLAVGTGQYKRRGALRSL